MHPRVGLGSSGIGISSSPGLGAEAARALGALLPRLGSLQKLTVGLNERVGDAGGAAILQALAEPGAGARLRELWLFRCGLGAAAAEALAAVLPRLGALQDATDGAIKTLSFSVRLRPQTSDDVIFSTRGPWRSRQLS